MTIAGATRAELASTLRRQRAYSSLVWALRFAVLTVTMCVLTAIMGVDTLILIGLICPIVSLLLLLATMVAVVASQARPQLPDDSLQTQLQLPISVIALAGRDAVRGVPGS
ncbi:hypothetical protein Rhe02_80780 [Rhizocola hellebori]|uniref:Uncharacterized protein n=1 Tax=Rhizocola hellebori TaxID=1392758 RepID=A0A8J3QIT4_9ACTN|nr:hypothetical protein [Rhizocola hellebori]GIH10011.1 hypothetical protein Rhe02_80780 [Rhizocola hellebori]